MEAAQSFINIPVLRVDVPLADMAIATGVRIGMVATLPTTLKPTVALIKRQAALAGKDVELLSNLCAGAFQAVAGDSATHDCLVTTGIREF